MRGRIPEPCLCGATDCAVCGPLQGYSKCPVCKKWDCDNESHTEPEEPPEVDEYWDQAFKWGEKG